MQLPNETLIKVQPSPILKRATTAPSAMTPKSLAKVVFSDAVQTRTIQPVSPLENTILQHAVLHTPTSARKSPSPTHPIVPQEPSSLAAGDSNTSAALLNLHHLILVQSCVRRWLQRRRYFLLLRQHRAALCIQSLWFDCEHYLSTYMLFIPVKARIQVPGVGSCMCRCAT